MSPQYPPLHWPLWFASPVGHKHHLPSHTHTPWDSDSTSKLIRTQTISFGEWNNVRLCWRRRIFETFARLYDNELQKFYAILWFVHNFFQLHLHCILYSFIHFVINKFVPCLVLLRRYPVNVYVCSLSANTSYLTVLNDAQMLKLCAVEFFTLRQSCYCCLFFQFFFISSSSFYSSNSTFVDE